MDFSQKLIPWKLEKQKIHINHNFLAGFEVSEIFIFRSARKRAIDPKNTNLIILRDSNFIFAPSDSPRSPDKF